MRFETRKIVLRNLGDEDLKRLAREYMQERFGWVSDRESLSYVTRFAETLEIMGYFAERQELAKRADEERARERASKENSVVLA